MNKLLTAILVVAFCQYLHANELDAMRDLSECVWKELPNRDSLWLSTVPSEEINVSSLLDWSKAVVERVPEELRLGIGLAGKRALAGAEFKLEKLNQFHDRLLDAFRSMAAESLSIKGCGGKEEVADLLYTATVDRFGADVRFSTGFVRSRFEEVSPLAKYYSGNVMFDWAALKFSGVDVSLERVLALYSPSPERIRLYIDAEQEKKVSEKGVRERS